MHILHIIHGYPPTYNAGSEVYTQALCEALVAQGHKVSIFTREENPYRPDFDLRVEQRQSDLTLYLVNLPREKDGYAHPVLDQKFAQLLADLQLDVAHIGHLNHLSTGLVDVLHEQGVPIVFTLHDFWLMCPRGQFLQVNFAQQPYSQLCERQEDRKCATRCYNRYFAQSDAPEEDLGYWTNWVHRRMQATQALCEKVDRFLAPSRALRNRFIRDFGIAPERIDYLDYGFEQTRLQGRKREAGEPFTFGYIGTHIPAKGVNLLLEAFAQLSGDAQLRIWGRSNGQSTHALRQMAAACPHPVAFLGEYVNSDIVPEVFNQVDAIVVPSIWMENSPLVIHEAQGAGVPVITANAGGMAEYVQHQVNGLLFTHRDSHSLAQQMQYALHHTQQMQALGARGYLAHPDGQVPDMHSHTQTLSHVYETLLPTHTHA